MMFYLYLLVFVVALAFLFFKIGRRKKGFSAADFAYVAKHWKNVSGLLKDNPSLAVLEGDKLLDFCIGKKCPRYKKLSLGEKLKSCGALFSDINGVWSAHKLRNRIAHELSLNVSSSECSRAISVFKRALNDLGAL